MVSKNSCPRCGADVMPDKAELAGVTYTDYYCGLRVGDDGSIDDCYASECYKTQLKKEHELANMYLLELSKVEEDRVSIEIKWMETDKALKNEISKTAYSGETINHLLNEIDILRVRHRKRIDRLDLELSVATAKRDVLANALLIASSLLYIKYGFTVDHPKGIYHWLIGQAEEEIKRNELR